jgi:hypothetical protein
MTIIRPHTKPPLWWLFPWSYASTLHSAANALRALCDRQDALLKGKYTTRPRWQIVPHINLAEGVAKFYFQDTDPEMDRAKETTVLRGKAFLYDGPSKSFVIETDPAKAIERVTELNAQ